MSICVHLHVYVWVWYVGGKGVWLSAENDMVALENEEEEHKVPIILLRSKGQRKTGEYNYCHCY